MQTFLKNFTIDYKLFLAVKLTEIFFAQIPINIFMYNFKSDYVSIFT